MKLSDMKKGSQVLVKYVKNHSAHDVIAKRLEHLGFVLNESVQITAKGPFGGDPILVKLGNTKFALRKSEAARIYVEPVASGL